ncbi:uncharacterized protein LOC142794052 [Rhipicephalus microplus]|uniref:uncharacterized protein LOC142794052 n=1 Tax=Rhipicephalus microplus TaxID=6941 RepID=UPI003F6BF5F5
MSSRANDRGANQVPSPANYGDPSKEPPSPSSESSVRKKQRRSKLGTASISKRPGCQNRRSSQGAVRKVPGAPDNARRGATQEPDQVHRLCEIHVRFKLLVETTCVGLVYGVHATLDSDNIAANLVSAVPVVFCDAFVGAEKTQPMASDLASIVSGKIRRPRHSYDRIGDKHHVSGTRTKRAGLSSAAEPPSSLSSLDIPPELRESRHELDRRTKCNPSTRGDKTTDPVGRLLEAPQATWPLPLSSLQGSISPAPTQAHGSDVLHESLEGVMRRSHGSLIPSASTTNRIPTPAVVPATTVSSPGVSRNTRDTCSVKRGDRLPGRRDDNKDATNSSIALTAMNGDVNLIGGCRRTDGTVNLESEGAPTIISAVAPLSEAGAQVSATTDQQPDTALGDMAYPPTMLERLLNPLRKRAHFGSVTHRLLSPRSTTTVTATPHKNRSWSFSTDDKWPQITVVTTLAIAATLVLYSLLHGTTRSGGGDTSGNSPTPCQTTDCIQHADLFAHWLNTSIDPCEDFAAFVCSAWSHRAQYRRGESTSVRQEVVLDFTEKLAETIGAGMTQIPVGSKPLAMFRTCIEVTAHSAHSKDVIRRFLADEGIPWPMSTHSPPSGTAPSPLEILMRFAIKWQLPLWFNVLVLPELAGGHRVVLIADNPQMRGWEARHKGLEATNSTFEYWSAHYEALTPPGNAQTPQPPSRSQCEEGHERKPTCKICGEGHETARWVSTTRGKSSWRLEKNSQLERLKITPAGMSVLRYLNYSESYIADADRKMRIPVNVRASLSIAPTPRNMHATFHNGRRKGLHGNEATRAAAREHVSRAALGPKDTRAMAAEMDVVENTY